MATAAKLARIIYTMLKTRSAFVDPGEDAYTKKHHDRVLRGLKRRAAALGLALVSAPEPEEAPA